MHAKYKAFILVIFLKNKTIYETRVVILFPDESMKETPTYVATLVSSPYQSFCLVKYYFRMQ
jgi:hypothetical protein